MARVLKILHVGNIANNAYVNARLLTEAGHVNHVACYDFYHFAGCSEWQDMAYDIDRSLLGDPNFPNFWRLGPERPASPRWFAQGPQRRVLTYLHFLNAGEPDLAHWAWCCLHYARFKVTNGHDTMADTRIWSEREFQAAIAGCELSAADRADIYLGRTAEMIGARFRYAMCKIADRAAVANVTFPIARDWLRGVTGWDPNAAALVTGASSDAFFQAIGLEDIPVPDFNCTRLTVEEQARAEQFRVNSKYWRSIMSHYDVVMGYGPDAATPFLAGREVYAAYEHGTLRDIPFEPTALGMLVTKAYEAAAVVYVTNNDYFTQEQQLKIEPDRLFSLPHAFDERVVREHVAASRPAPEPKVTFLAPARQDWVKQYRTMTKNNHFVVHAVVALRDLGYRDFQVRFVAWGNDVEATEALIAQFGVESFFDWIKPLAKRQLWDAYVAAHAVIDQFLLPSISGVSFEALALGRRVITRDDGSNAVAFEEGPPLLDAHDVDSLIVQMRRVLDDPDDKAGIGRAAWEWVNRKHSGARIVAIQQQQMSRLAVRQ